MVLIPSIEKTGNISIRTLRSIIYMCATPRQDKLTFTRTYLIWLNSIKKNRSSVFLRSLLILRFKCSMKFCGHITHIDWWDKV